VKFYTQKRRQPTVPIVTLIDILAILLIFFIVTTTFKQRQSLLKVNLPKSSQMGESGEASPRTILALSKDGNVSLGDQVVPLEQLGEVLRTFRSQQPDALLELKADEGAPLGRMVEVWDAAVAAGIDLGELPLRILLE
jgi:biopolymer transport protein ExbD